MALLIVLMRAGLAIRLVEINANKAVVFLFSTVPYLSEFMVWLYAGNVFFSSWSRFEMGLFAAVMSPVGPSVIINQLLAVLAERRHKVGFVPRQVVITAPLEAVLAIVIFEWFDKLFQSHEGDNRKYVGC